MHTRRSRLFHPWPLVQLLALLAVGCNNAPPAMPGKLTLHVRGLPLTAPGAVLSRATLQLGHLHPIGDVPTPPLNPPPMLTVDLLDPLGATYVFEHPPPGFYSRLELSADDMLAIGTWRSTPLTIHLGLFGGVPVGLRSATGQEIGNDQNGTFEVTVDLDRWFAMGLLDTAMVSAGAITCDAQHNLSVTQQLTMRLVESLVLE